MGMCQCKQGSYQAIDPAATNPATAKGSAVTKTATKAKGKTNNKPRRPVEDGSFPTAHDRPGGKSTKQPRQIVEKKVKAKDTGEGKKTKRQGTPGEKDEANADPSDTSTPKAGNRRKVRRRPSSKSPDASMQTIPESLETEKKQQQQEQDTLSAPPSTDLDPEVDAPDGSENDPKAVATRLDEHENEEKTKVIEEDGTTVDDDELQRPTSTTDIPNNETLAGDDPSGSNEKLIASSSPADAQCRTMPNENVVEASPADGAIFEKPLKKIASDNETRKQSKPAFGGEDLKAARNKAAVTMPAPPLSSDDDGNNVSDNVKGRNLTDTKPNRVDEGESPVRLRPRPDKVANDDQVLVGETLGTESDRERSLVTRIPVSEEGIRIDAASLEPKDRDAYSEESRRRPPKPQHDTGLSKDQIPSRDTDDSTKALLVTPDRASTELSDRETEGVASTTDPSTPLVPRVGVKPSNATSAHSSSDYPFVTPLPKEKISLKSVRDTTVEEETIPKAAATESLATTQKGALRLKEAARGPIEEVETAEPNTTGDTMAAVPFGIGATIPQRKDGGKNDDGTISEPGPTLNLDEKSQLSPVDRSSHVIIGTSGKTIPSHQVLPRRDQSSKVHDPDSEEKKDENVQPKMESTATPSSRSNPATAGLGALTTSIKGSPVESRKEESMAAPQSSSTGKPATVALGALTTTIKGSSVERGKEESSGLDPEIPTPDITRDNSVEPASASGNESQHPEDLAGNKGEDDPSHGEDEARDFTDTTPIEDLAVGAAESASGYGVATTATATATAMTAVAATTATYGGAAAAATATAATAATGVAVGGAAVAAAATFLAATAAVTLLSGGKDEDENNAEDDEEEGDSESDSRPKQVGSFSGNIEGKTSRADLEKGILSVDQQLGYHKQQANEGDVETNPHVSIERGVADDSKRVGEASVLRDQNRKEAAAIDPHRVQTVGLRSRDEMKKNGKTTSSIARKYVDGGDLKAMPKNRNTPTAKDEPSDELLLPTTALSVGVDNSRGKQDAVRPNKKAAKEVVSSDSKETPTNKKTPTAKHEPSVTQKSMATASSVGAVDSRGKHDTVLPTKRPAKEVVSKDLKATPRTRNTPSVKQEPSTAPKLAATASSVGAVDSRGKHDTVLQTKRPAKEVVSKDLKATPRNQNTPSVKHDPNTDPKLAGTARSVGEVDSRGKRDTVPNKKTATEVVSKDLKATPRNQNIPSVKQEPSTAPKLAARAHSVGEVDSRGNANKKLVKELKATPTIQKTPTAKHVPGDVPKVAATSRSFGVGDSRGEQGTVIAHPRPAKEVVTSDWKAMPTNQTTPNARQDQANSSFEVIELETPAAKSKGQRKSRKSGIVAPKVRSSTKSSPLDPTDSERKKRASKIPTPSQRRMRSDVFSPASSESSRKYSHRRMPSSSDSVTSMNSGRVSSSGSVRSRQSRKRYNSAEKLSSAASIASIGSGRTSAAGSVSSRRESFIRYSSTERPTSSGSVASLNSDHADSGGSVGSRRQGSFRLGSSENLMHSSADSVGSPESIRSINTSGSVRSVVSGVSVGRSISSRGSLRKRLTPPHRPMKSSSHSVASRASLNRQKSADRKIPSSSDSVSSLGSGRYTYTSGRSRRGGDGSDGSSKESDGSVGSRASRASRTSRNSSSRHESIPLGSNGRIIVPLYHRTSFVGGVLHVTCPNTNWNPSLHKTYEGCERCLYMCDDDERDFFFREGHHHRVQLCRGGCGQQCAIFPRREDEEPARLCVQCFYATHGHGRGKMPQEPISSDFLMEELGFDEIQGILGLAIQEGSDEGSKTSGGEEKNIAMT